MENLLYFQQIRINLSSMIFTNIGIHKCDLKDVYLKYIDEHIELVYKNHDGDYFEECLLSKEAIEDEYEDFLSELNLSE